ncbi:hypothetical protein [Pseudomonas sp. NPDC089569]|uniref:hypothetical protein n=1 Tax=Pseudomonas sp. NPDC089569 TaxID=3390722 RepID=UPI003CFEA66A
MGAKPTITLTMSAELFELCAKLYNPETPDQLLAAVRPMLVDGLAPADARAPYAEKVTRQGQSNYASILRAVYTETVMKMSPTQFELCVQFSGVDTRPALLEAARAVLVDRKIAADVVKSKHLKCSIEDLESTTTAILETHWKILGVYGAPKAGKVL